MLLTVLLRTLALGGHAVFELAALLPEAHELRAHVPTEVAVILLKLLEQLVVLLLELFVILLELPEPVFLYLAHSRARGAGNEFDDMSDCAGQ